jgi:hypothetical protein
MNDNLKEIEFHFRNREGYIFGLPTEFQTKPVVMERSSKSVICRFLTSVADWMISSGNALKKSLAEPSVNHHSVA